MTIQDFKKIQDSDGFEKWVLDGQHVVNLSFLDSGAITVYSVLDNMDDVSLSIKPKEIRKCVRISGDCILLPYYKTLTPLFSKNLDAILR